MTLRNGRRETERKIELVRTIMEAVPGAALWISRERDGDYAAKSSAGDYLFLLLMYFSSRTDLIKTTMRILTTQEALTEARRVLAAMLHQREAAGMFSC